MTTTKQRAPIQRALLRRVWRRQVQALFADAKIKAFPARSRLVRWLDAVFIGFLEEHPQRGGEIFYRLFNRVPSDALVRFLGDRARPSDVIRVMKTLVVKNDRTYYSFNINLHKFIVK